MSQIDLRCASCGKRTTQLKRMRRTVASRATTKNSDEMGEVVRWLCNRCWKKWLPRRQLSLFG